MDGDERVVGYSFFRGPVISYYGTCEFLDQARKVQCLDMGPRKFLEERYLQPENVSYKVFPEAERFNNMVGKFLSHQVC